jgi:hypothetical protein
MTDFFEDDVTEIDDWFLWAVELTEIDDWFPWTVERLERHYRLSIEMSDSTELKFILRGRYVRLMIDKTVAHLPTILPSHATDRER